MCTVWPSHSKLLSEWSNESPSDFALSLNDARSGAPKKCGRNASKMV